MRGDGHLAAARAGEPARVDKGGVVALRRRRQACPGPARPSSAPEVGGVARGEHQRRLRCRREAASAASRSACSWVDPVTSRAPVEPGAPGAPRRRRRRRSRGDGGPGRGSRWRPGRAPGCPPGAGAGCVAVRRPSATAARSRSQPNGSAGCSATGADDLTNAVHGRGGERRRDPRRRWPAAASARRRRRAGAPRPRAARARLADREPGALGRRLDLDAGHRCRLRRISRTPGMSAQQRRAAPAGSPTRAAWATVSRSAISRRLARAAAQRTAGSRCR